MADRIILTNDHNVAFAETLDHLHLASSSGRSSSSPLSSRRLRTSATFASISSCVRMPCRHLALQRGRPALVIAQPLVHVVAELLDRAAVFVACDDALGADHGAHAVNLLSQKARSWGAVSIGPASRPPTSWGPRMCFPSRVFLTGSCREEAFAQASRKRAKSAPTV